MLTPTMHWRHRWQNDHGYVFKYITMGITWSELVPCKGEKKHVLVYSDQSRLLCAHGTNQNMTVSMTYTYFLDHSAAFDTICLLYLDPEPFRALNIKSNIFNRYKKKPQVAIVVICNIGMICSLRLALVTSLVPFFWTVFKDSVTLQ